MEPRKEPSKKPEERRVDDVIEPKPGDERPDVIEPPFERKKALGPKEIK